MCQYTDKCPVVKHRDGTPCPVILRQRTRTRKAIWQIIIYGIFIIVMLNMQYHFLW